MFTLFRSERGPIKPLDFLKQPAKAALLNDARTSFINATVRATVSIATAAATAIRNRGSAWALFPEIGIIEGGKKRWQADPRPLIHAAEAASPSGLTKTRLASTAVGSYNLVEHMRVALAHPYAVDPRETWYDEHNPLLELAFYAILDDVPTALARLMDKGASAVPSLDSLSISVQQGYDLSDKKLPLFIPTVEQIITNVNAANPKLEIPLKVSDRLRAIVISQDADPKGEVTDIINTVELRGDRNRWIEQVAMDDLAREQEFEMGGDVYGSAKGSHVYLNFQREGRLARTLSPVQQDTNLRLVLDAQPSAGAASSRVVVTLFKLERDPFVGADGRRVVDPTVPFDLV